MLPRPILRACHGQLGQRQIRRGKTPGAELDIPAIRSVFVPQNKETGRPIPVYSETSFRARFFLRGSTRDFEGRKTWTWLSSAVAAMTQGSFWFQLKSEMRLVKPPCMKRLHPLAVSRCSNILSALTVQGDHPPLLREFALCPRRPDPRSRYVDHCLSWQGCWHYEDATEEK
jgi:hypothetical protein